MERNGRAPTIYDLARLAGVSPSTVSRALRGRGQVSAATVLRIQDAATALRYRPNAVARSLTVRQSNSLAVMLPDIANPFFPALVREVQLRAHSYGKTVLLCNTGGEPAAEIEYLEMLASQQIEGVVAMGLKAAPSRVRRYLRSGMRIVALDRPSSVREIVAVQADHRLGGALATSHLIEMGHRHIGLISGPPGISVAADRRAGCLDALTREGLTLAPQLEVAGDFSGASGYQAAQELVATGITFTALVVANDLMALGAMAALRQAGFRVPEDVSVVGFDDIDLGRYATPALTTVRQPLHLMAAAAVDLLLGLPPEVGLDPARIPVALVLRGSTAPPAAGRTRRRPGSAARSSSSSDSHRQRVRLVEGN